MACSLHCQIYVYSGFLSMHFMKTCATHVAMSAIQLTVGVESVWGVVAAEQSFSFDSAFSSFYKREECSHTVRSCRMTPSDFRADIMHYVHGHMNSYTVDPHQSAIRTQSKLEANLGMRLLCFKVCLLCFLPMPQILPTMLPFSSIML